MSLSRQRDIAQQLHLLLLMERDLAVKSRAQLTRELQGVATILDHDSGPTLDKSEADSGSAPREADRG